MSGLKAVTEVEEIDRFRASDLEDLCDATDAAIKDGGGFGWVDPPDRAAMERYWKGVLRFRNVRCSSDGWTASSAAPPSLCARPGTTRRSASPPP